MINDVIEIDHAFNNATTCKYQTKTAKNLINKRLQFYFNHDQLNDKQVTRFAPPIPNECIA